MQTDPIMLTEPIVFVDRDAYSTLAASGEHAFPRLRKFCEITTACPIHDCAALISSRPSASACFFVSQDPTPEGGGLQFQVSFPGNALSGTDCNGLLDGSPILPRTENYATTNRIEMQACSAVGGTCAFLPSPEGRGFSRFFGEGRVLGRQSGCGCVR